MSMRLTKIYTKIGDGGNTMLATGAKVSKAAKRICAYGTVDELNAVVGMLRDELVEVDRLRRDKIFSDLNQHLLMIQNELFDLGGELSVPVEHLDVGRQQVVTLSAIQRLEDQMDLLNEHLPPLKNFILPGGHRANSAAHLARTVCRRAEREVIALSELEEVRSEARIYLNRLSDWLFVICRELSSRLNVEEILWSQRGK